MAYIALKPVRFNKNYAIDETIPDNEVSPKMEKKLIEMGMIAKAPENPQNPNGNAPNLNEPNTGDKIPDDGKNGAQGQNNEPVGGNDGDGGKNGNDGEDGTTPPGDEKTGEPEPAKKNHKK